jgi:hypothetical protein
MAGDIEDFLRRAAERRAPRAQPPVSGVPQPPLEVQILGDDDVIDTEIVDAYPVEDPGIMAGHDVGDHVSQHINTSDVGERLSHMGEGIDHADDRMEAHMHDYFEHQLGDLGASTSRTSESSLDDDSPVHTGPGARKKRPALNFRKLLRSPTSVRDAIVLSEILRRPEDRW